MENRGKLGRYGFQTRWAIGLMTLLGTGGLGWSAVHRIPGLGPQMADWARSVVGDDAVARAEDFAYGLQDRVDRWRYRGTAPVARWQPQEAAVKPTSLPRTIHEEVGATVIDEPQSPELSAFRLADVGVLFDKQAAPGDGRWVSVPLGAGVAYRTLIHPDPERPYSELFVAALDLRQLVLHAAAGMREPENVAEGAEKLTRTGRIPDGDISSLFAAFNGGFKTRHGRFGMSTDGVMLVPPREQSCTVAQYEDGTLRIGTWASLPSHGAIQWFRQTPGCIVEAGTQNPALRDSKKWGATLDGKTVIRRSAIGLSANRQVLYVGISNATDAEALARGMRHAGAVDAAQLDVNHSYPRFLFYANGVDGESIVPLAEGFVYRPGHYLSHRSDRDFFYLTHRQSVMARGPQRSGLVEG